MKLISYALLDQAQRYVAQGFSSAGAGPREVYSIAVCKDQDDFYLFSCDGMWQVMFDTYHESLEAAERQAEYEHPGILKRMCRIGEN